MTDEQLLLLCVIFLYLVECACLIRREEIAFSGKLLRGWRVRRGVDGYGNDRWSILLNNPLPPWGCSVICQSWPVSASPDGVCSYAPAAPNPGERPVAPVLSYIRYEEIRSVAAQGQEVRINGSEFLRVGSQTYAHRLAEWINELQEAPADRRAELIDTFISRSLDPAEVERKVRDCRDRSRTLLLLCTLLFLLVFAGAPALISGFGLINVWLPWLAGLLLLNTATAWTYFRTHQHLYPERRDERWLAIAGMALFPLATIRGYDRCWRDRLAGHHPLAVARVLCPAAEFRRIAGDAVRDLAHPLRPLCPPELPQAAETVESFHHRTRNLVHAFLAAADVDTAALLAQPAREEDSVCYCPRCTLQYIVEKQTCEHCGGLEVRRFA